MVHHLKIEPRYLNDLVNGYKSFEIRNNDRNYQVGDVLKFGDYEFTVTYIHQGLGLLPGYVAMSVKPVQIPAGRLLAWQI